jgi:CBS domain-containing protein
MQVAEIMTSNPECCVPDDGLVEAARIMQRRDVGLVPIIESRDTRRLVGCVTDRDIVVRVVSDGRNPEVVLCREVMSESLVCCSPDDLAERASELMQEHQLHRIMVCDEDGSLVGVVSTADVARALDIEEVGRALESISLPSGGTPTV